MNMNWTARYLILVLAVLSAGIVNSAQFSKTAASVQGHQETETGGVSAPPRTHPAIEYPSRPLKDAVTDLKSRVDAGEVHLTFEKDSGYLRSILEALHVPLESQVAVFSKTSLQSERIGPDNPRTIFFNDSVAVAWPRGGFIELAATDPQQGVVFYTFNQFRIPEFRRDEECLVCHVSAATLRVPGLAVGSVFPESDGEPSPKAPMLISDHRSPLDQRWGGWYVTGENVSIRHLGNRVVTDPNKPESLTTDPIPHFESLKGQFDISGYLSPYSDIVSLMVLDHQAHMTNLITRSGWESRVASYDKASGAQVNSKLIDDHARELVDYLLFVDEAPLPGKLQGTSGFAEKFSAGGSRDSKGRSLRELDLGRRMMRYSCSYMIYSAQFDGLPAETKELIYRRMWTILSGQEKGEKYSKLSSADRSAVIEILRDTKKDLPSYFQAAAVR